MAINLSQEKIEEILQKTTENKNSLIKGDKHKDYKELCENPNLYRMWKNCKNPRFALADIQMDIFIENLLPVINGSSVNSGIPIHDEEAKELLLKIYMHILQKNLPERIGFISRSGAGLVCADKIFRIHILEKCPHCGNTKYYLEFEGAELEKLLEFSHDGTKRGSNFVYVGVDSSGMIYEIGKTNAEKPDLLERPYMDGYIDGSGLAWGLAWYYLLNKVEKAKWKNVMTDNSKDFRKYIEDKWEALPNEAKQIIVNKSNDVITDAIIIPVNVNMETTNEKVNKMNDKDKADSIAESIEHEVGNLFIDNGFPIFDAYSHRIHPRRIIRKELKEKKEVTVP